MCVSLGLYMYTYMQYLHAGRLVTWIICGLSLRGNLSFTIVRLHPTPLNILPLDRTTGLQPTLWTWYSLTNTSHSTTLLLPVLSCLPPSTGNVTQYKRGKTKQGNDKAFKGKTFKILDLPNVFHLFWRHLCTHAKTDKKAEATTALWFQNLFLIWYPS